MAKATTPKTFIARSRSWAAKKGIFGSQAFLRYVMLSYLEALGQVPNDFVFKGGNLLYLHRDPTRHGRSGFGYAHVRESCRNQKGARGGLWSC